MAITGCYDLRVTCDATQCVGAQYPGGPGRTSEFAGDETGARARARARRSGWKLDIERSVSVCPACAEAGVRTQDVEPQ